MDYLNIKQEAFIQNKFKDKEIIARLLDQKDIDNSIISGKKDLDSDSFSNYMDRKNEQNDSMESRERYKKLLEIEEKAEKSQERSCSELYLT